MLIHMCRRCGFQSMIFDEWFNHLWGKQHQDVTKTSFLNWDDDENGKSLVIYSPPEVSPPLPSDILTLFMKQGCLIVDLVCWTQQPRNFVVQFQHQDDLEKVLKIYTQQPSELSIGGNAIQFRRKRELLSYEWTAIVGVGNIEASSSTEAVLIELSDDSNSDNGEGNGNGSSNGNRNPTTNGKSNGNVVEDMDVDDAAPGVEANEESSSEDDEDYSVEFSTDMSAEFQKQFLDKSKQKSGKDDKKSVAKNLKQLGSLWLDVFVAFNNKLWPCCFMMSNKIKKTNINEIGFEAVFHCDCLNSKRNVWLENLPDTRKEQRQLAKSKIEKFLEIISDEDACEKKLQGLSKLKSYEEKNNRPLLKFKCHMIVTYSDNGAAKATLKFEEIKGRKKIRKMDTVVDVFKLLFKEFEKNQIEEWSPKQKIVSREVQNDGVKKERKWTEIEIITVE